MMLWGALQARFEEQKLGCVVFLHSTDCKQGMYLEMHQDLGKQPMREADSPKALPDTIPERSKTCRVVAKRGSTGNRAERTSGNTGLNLPSLLANENDTRASQGKQVEAFNSYDG